MQKPLKFNIKLSFTSEILQNNRDDIDVSSYLDNLLNKKINIHLKINLDKIHQQFQKKKLFLSPNDSFNNSEREIILNNSIGEDSCESIIELEKEIVPKLTSNRINNRKLSLYKNISNKKIPKSQNSTLVLDLDETLVYVLDEKNDNLSLPQIPFEYYILDEEENTIKNEEFKNRENETIEKAKNYLIIRPGFANFIQQVKKYFDEIIIFTSSQYSYAEEIIKIIDKNKIISKIYSRKDCSFYNDIFYKDLNKIKKDLSKTIIIDNYPECYLLQHFNGLPIPSFMGDEKDNELLKLLPILEKLSKVKDVRNYIREIVSVDGENILFNKANELLKIKKEELNKNKNSNPVKINKNKIVPPLNKIRLTNNTWKKSNLKISDLIEKSNNKTIEHDSEEKIVSNNFNDYFFIEKNMEHLSTIKPNKNNKMSIAKKIILNPNESSNKKTKKKNLILEYSYNNRQYNYQTTLQANPLMFNNTNNENLYENLKTPESNINSEIIKRNNNTEYKSQNMALNSARHFKSKSLFNNDENLFKNKIYYQSLNNSRNNSNKNNLSFKNYTVVPFKNSNKNA